MARVITTSKYMMVAATLALLIASIGAIGWGLIKTAIALQAIIVSYGQSDLIALKLIQVVDAFLVAIALFVFAVSIYELFIADLGLPDWMLAHNLYELKVKLSSVIVLVMAIKFLEKLVEEKDLQALLYNAIAISVVAAVLIAFSYFGKKD